MFESKLCIWNMHHMLQHEITFGASTKPTPAPVSLTSDLDINPFSTMLLGLVTDQDDIAVPEMVIDTSTHAVQLVDAMAVGHRQDPTPTPDDRTRSLEDHIGSEMLTIAYDVASSNLDGHADKTTTVQKQEASSLETEDEPYDDASAKYELRPQTRHSGVGFTSTWVDQDETGDYDPSAERRKLSMKRSRMRHLAPQCHSMPSDGGDPDHMELAPVQQEQPSLHVTLQVKSDGGKAKLRKVLDTAPTQSAIEYDAFVKTWHPKKKKRPGRQRKITKPVEESKPVKCADLPDDLTGYPLARGCWGCLGLGVAFAQTCSLLHDEYEYPCANCKAGGDYCVPIQPPKYKQQCEACKQRKKPCSYTYTIDHEGPCEECAAIEFQCAAGPLREEIKPRIRYDRSPAELKLIAEALKATERQWQPKSRPIKRPKKASTRSTLEAEASNDKACPLARCDQSNDHKSEGLVKDCLPRQAVSSPSKISEPQAVSIPKKQIFIDLTEDDGIAPNKEHQPTSPPKKRSSVDMTEPPAPKKQRVATRQRQSSPSTHTTAARNSGKVNTLTINTGFCHPIAFNHEAQPTAKHKPDCNFCDGSAFPFLSYTCKDVKVIELPNGRGYKELSGGYAAQGHKQTRMCTKCTVQRMTIVTCQAHVLRPLRSKNDLDYEGALDALFADRPRKQDSWCSVCPALAAYQCQAKDCMDAMGNPCLGCGLLLCQTCKAELGRKYGGDLQVMLGRLEKKPDEVRPLGLRADAEFLRQDGLLMRFVMWSVDAEA